MKSLTLLADNEWTVPTPRKCSAPSWCATSRVSRRPSSCSAWRTQLSTGDACTVLGQTGCKLKSKDGFRGSTDSPLPPPFFLLATLKHCTDTLSLFCSLSLYKLTCSVPTFTCYFPFAISGCPLKKHSCPLHKFKLEKSMLYLIFL